MATHTTDRAAYHHGDLRAALLDVAEGLIRERGPARVTLRAIARRAGVSHAAPYHHFADLDDLLATLAARGFTRLRKAMLQRAGAAAGPPLSRLQQAGVAYVRFATENPELYRLMFGGRLEKASSHSELTAASTAAYAGLCDLLGPTAEPDEARPGSASVHASAAGRGEAAWATVHGLSMLLIDRRLDVDLADADAVEALARDVTRVLGPGLRGVG